MKLHPDPSSVHNTITAYGAGYVEINRERYTHSVLVQPKTPVQTWPVSSFSALSNEHFSMLTTAAPAEEIEIVIFGSGAQLRFPSAELIRTLTARRIGVETMDLYAACRTYNILVAEGRQVVAALLIEMI
ncbi:Mth938-like domain-containing protein [Mycoavidus sp. HKI]|uniref:Mth938-like domain-containing protein n=1 Tax=Mycoavidus sp. HKI TaxID=2840467 RepID=UPI001CBB695C|nr:Mth938-like domain-containing protein [Mycoavidus sp. HKI]UAW64442.1 Mth938-like domain-containing protein [Mycoavidus sp. HKI]